MNNSRISVLAAGSFFNAVAILIQKYKEDYPNIQIDYRCGPAGILRGKILSGEACSLFVSADYKNTKKVSDAFCEAPVVPVCRSSLCVIALKTAATNGEDAMTLLSNPCMRIGTSTPGDDPCGDYTQKFFEMIRKESPELANSISARSKALVGGRHSNPVPSGKKVALWLLETGQCDVFIGYRAFGNTYKGKPEIVTADIPQRYTIHPEWYMTYRPDAHRLAEFIVSPLGRSIIRSCGFLDSKSELIR